MFPSPQPNAPIRKRSHAVRRSSLADRTDSDFHCAGRNGGALMAPRDDDLTMTPAVSPRPKPLASPQSAQLTSKRHGEVRHAVPSFKLPNREVSEDDTAPAADDFLRFLDDDDLPGNPFMRARCTQLTGRTLSLEETCP